MKFLQVGDTHLGYRQYGIRSREDDFRAAFGRICAIAIEKKVDAVVFTGDTFETSRPTVKDLVFARDMVLELMDKKIAVFGIEGNHDSAGGDILKAIDVQHIGQSKYEIKGITFHGIDYCNKTEFVKRLEDVEDDVNVLVMHQTLSEVAELFGDVSAAHIAKTCPQLKYVALGHIHNPSTIHHGDTYFCYNGSTEMNEISESSEKTVPLVTIKGSQLETKIELIPLECRKVLKLSLSTEDDVKELYRNLSDYTGNLLYLVVDTKLAKQASSILQEADDHGIDYTLSTVSGTADIDLSKVKTWERSRSTLDLKAIIEEDFGDMEEEQAIVSALLEAPHNMKRTVEEYIDAIRNREEDSDPGQRIHQLGSSQVGQISNTQLREGSGEQTTQTSDEPEAEAVECGTGGIS